MSTDTSPIDLWDELQRSATVPAVSQEAMLSARVAVRRAATTETLRTDVLRIRRRRRMRVSTVLIGTAAASAIIGVARVDLGGHQISPPNAAATVLERAADATLAQHDLVAGPGQYLRVRLVEQGWSRQVDSFGKTLVGKDARPAVSQERRTRTIWIPHDLGLPWVIREGTVVMRNNSTDPRFQETAEPTKTWKQPGWADPDHRGYVRTYDPRWYATLPSDPAQLMKTLRRQSTAEGSGAAYDFEEIYSEVLRSGVAPAGIRAALFTGLAQRPGMRVDDTVTTLDGRKGIGIRHGTSTWEMVFDTTTGHYIGERATDSGFPSVPGLDGDKTTWLTSVTTEVVDQAPNARTSK